MRLLDAERLAMLAAFEEALGLVFAAIVLAWSWPSWLGMPRLRAERVAGRARPHGGTRG